MRLAQPIAWWTAAVSVAVATLGPTPPPGAGASAFGATLSPRPPAREGPVVFAEVTAQAGIDFVETIGDHRMSNIVESTGVGCGFLDYDGDDLLDIYLVNGCWLREISDPRLEPRERERLAAATDRLYRNLGAGRFADVTIRAGVARAAYGMGLVAADYDGDGDTDIYITNFGNNFLYRNRGEGTFTEVAAVAGVDDPHFGVGAAFLDYDADGRLDLYLGNYLAYDPQVQRRAKRPEVVGPLEYGAQQDRLFRGLDGGRFAEVTAEAGVVLDPVGRAMGVGAFDYDNDGRSDLFVANDAMENFLLHNLGDGRFENQALLTGAAFAGGGEARAAMAVEAGDYDGDGFCDLVIPDLTCGCLYRNVQGRFFDEVTAPSGMAAALRPYHGWGSVLGDFDLDGDLDLFVSTGDARRLGATPDRLLVNDGEGRFTDASATAGAALAAEFVSRGAARGDFDNDGDLDLLVTHLNERPSLLRNDTPRRGRHWLGLRLIGRGPNRDAIGAVATVRAGNLVQTRFRGSGGSYLSQHDPRLHFGLGEHGKADLVEITWPDGSRQVLRNVPADRYATIHQEAAPKTAPEAATRPTEAQGAFSRAHRRGLR